MAFLWIRTAATAAVLLLAAACTTALPGADQPSTAASTGGGSVTGSPGVATGPVKVIVKRTGGLAGIEELITIEPTGEWVHTSRTGKRTGKLEKQQAEQLQTLAADARLAGEGNRSAAPTKCRDAFNYTVTMGTVRVGYVDCPSDPGLPVATQAVVNLISQYIG